MNDKEKIITQACELLQLIRNQEEKYDAINKQIRQIQGDFYMHIAPVDSDILTKLVEFLDVFLCNHASYWLYEEAGKDNGSVTHTNKDGAEVTYPLKTVEDLKNYALQFLKL